MKKNCKAGIGCGLWLFLVFCLTRNVYCATADETLVVANTLMPGSMRIAKYYMKQRNIPEDHLLLTSLTTNEVMERDQYDTGLKLPVRKKIDALSGVKIAAIVLIYGIPLKVLGPVPDRETAAKVFNLKNDLKILRESTTKAPDHDSRLRELERNIEHLLGEDQRAAVDSELALVKVKDYPLSGWIPNPYFIGFQNQQLKIGKDDVLLVCRLDGPDPQTVFRIIDDSLAAEKTGLHGIAYFDGRWPPPAANDKTERTGYRFYDASLYKAAEIVKKRMPVKVDSTEKLFPPGSAPEAALYAGWYSLGHYIDSFTWVKGAVGYHIASSECATLRNRNSTVWCVQMLEHGVAATIGPVYEPYVEGFPVPEIFFAAFTEGYLNLGESYLVSLPYISWQMVLVGDPLYRPFSPVTRKGNKN